MKNTIFKSIFGYPILVIVLSTTLAAINAAVQEQREAYFNGSAYIRLVQPMVLWRHSAISFRTCRGGELFSQSFKEHTLSVKVLSDGVSVSLVTPRANPVEARVATNLLDNNWHTLQFVYQAGNLNLVVEGISAVIANATYNNQFLIDDEIKRETAILIVGNKYSGCLLQGPNLVFRTESNGGVVFGPCPMALGKCSDTDILIREPIDHCKNEPCMQHGVCISKADGYECKCYARYDGKNCQIDNGSPCHANRNLCKNGALCEEDQKGDFKCHCLHGFTGHLCEQESNTHPLCEKYPCLNNGTCIIDSFNQIKCECLEGFSGDKCEHNRDYCDSQPCQNNGRCIDNLGGFICDCTGTGYAGQLCQNNIDECANGPCLNGGICFDNYGFYTCECPSGYGGQNCEQAVSECLSLPCQHGGTCIELNGGFECKCAPGFTGMFCEVTPPCNPPCPIDSECLGGRCMCKPGTTGVRCELPMALPFQESCDCLNGGTCINKTHCICPSGFDGKKCEKQELCSPTNCADPMQCLNGKCICPPNESCISPCVNSPCENGATCLAHGKNYVCQCGSGFNGTHCENDIDECKSQPDICENGICVNKPGSFQCYCEPGYTGVRCDLDVDECLSHPCRNNGTCINQINDFECECAPGYAGKDCSIDIDECASNPCSKGSTCINEIADFTCVCIPGMTGRLCEIDIDDCESQPCQHGGKCIDKLGGFKCDCDSTGFSGMLCQMNIDECASNPCQNQANCEDKINDYFCDCYPGYTGKNCEEDINECDPNPCQYGGKCLERSNQSLYQSSQQYSLPPTFSQKFSIENASGYECVCVPGTTGINCEVNINECDSSPCKNGNCNDQIGGYICDCEPGFEGEHCEIDINECDKYHPCVNGTCIDGRDDYVCDCDGGWGGKNCSVELIGCRDSPCLNDGSCIPFLENETDHRFNCSCLNGFQGSTCEQGTTMSLVASSLLTVNTTRAEGYDISLRFRTTLPNGILAFGNANAYSYILELKNGRLNLHSSLLNKWEGVFIGSNLNDTQWQKVFVAINSSHLVLSANEEQTIYPINSYEGSNMSHTSFPVTYLGGTIPNLHSYLRHLNNHEPTSFVGCMQDVVINGQWVLPGIQNPYTSLLNVQEGCQRTAQCDPNPCNSNGHCTDLWHTYRCTCQRPHLGPTCKYNITAATFGNENTNHSTVIVTVSDMARRTIRSMLNISMFVRTRQSTGTIFHLGSAPRSNPDLGSFVSAKLEKGELFVQMRFNGTPEAYTVGGNKLDNGYNHLIEVIRNGTLVQVKLNGTEYFRKTLSTSGTLNAQLLYLGGPPIDPEAAEQFTEEEKDQMYFKGIIQDVQISNGSEYGLMGVELYPLKEQEEGLELPRPFGEVTIDRTSVLEGVVSDDLCKTKPCQHDAECQNTWNDFVCICPRGYKGKLCQDIQFCELQKCPGNAECKNLDDGYDCVANITFQGNQEEPLAFSFSGKDDEQGVKIDSTIEISYRTKTGGTLLYVQDGDMYFEVAVLKDQVTIQWHLSSGLPETNRFHKDDTNIEWNTILIRIQDGKLEAGWKGWEDYLEPVPSISIPIDYNAFMHLFSGKFLIYLGGAPDNDVIPKGNDIGHMFKGCLGEIRVGGMLLPYFPHNEIYPEESSRLKSYFILNSTKPEEGCVVCFQQDCQNGGICTNASEVYACECPAGYANDDCSINIDECLESLCTNNSTCIDGIASYTCDCLPGWEGKYCEKEIDECASNPCHNGGTCTDLLAAFQCTCTEEYAGPQCDVLRLVTCENHPCKNGSTCLDGVNATTGNNFTCLCTPGFQGSLCDLAFCHVKPCENEGFCLVSDYSMSPKCQCSLGFEGEYCETNINDCDPNPCQNNGYCVDEVNGYQCNCHKTGFEGANCEIDIDECSSGLVSCGSGTCVNFPGSFKCECEYGLCGRGCAYVDYCAGVNVCENGGHCIETCDEGTDYFCNCTFGYTGKNCTEQVNSENIDISHNEIIVDDLNKKLEQVYNDSAVDDEVAIESKGPSTTDIALIVIPVVIGLLALLGILMGTLLVMARNKRATRGTYSPSAQEYCNPRLEMDNVLKPPPEERLI